MTNKNILLIEPNYKNKYPPIGLMKISTYHKMLGDNVTFYKGDLKSFLLDQILSKCIKQLIFIEPSIQWQNKSLIIREYISTKKIDIIHDSDLMISKNKPLLNNCLQFYKDYYIKRKYKNAGLFDRVYVTTLFTFYWKITIDTINTVKDFVNDPLENVKVGGIMASLLPEEVEEATGIKPIFGLLDKPRILDNDNDIIIDELYLDYSILDEIDYKYPTDSAYFGVMTKGCTRKCPFCSVPKLEPLYIPKLYTKERFKKVIDLFGEQKNLLLMDNNILASPELPSIIEEIKELGYVKGAMYIEPNQLDIAIKNLKSGLNDNAYIKRSYKIIHKLLIKIHGKAAESYYHSLSKHDILELQNTKKENLISAYLEIKDIYEKFRYKQPMQRFVDFNQGTDCRYITEDVVKILSQIPIRPLRIAFDYFGLKEQYIKAVELAAKYDIKELSNYILYNFHDTPEELYKRLRINNDLSKELDLHIYSFPMKYIPLDPTGRNFIGKHWNRKFIRAIQAIINVTKGIVAPATRSNNSKGNFFEKAFGKDIKEFHEILYMPESYIVYRKLFEEYLGYTEIWKSDFNSLSDDELLIVKPIIESNNFENIDSISDNPKIIKLLSHYTITKDISNSFAKKDDDYLNLKKRFDKLIKSDNLLKLTLTYEHQ